MALRERGLSRWDNEGGARPPGPDEIAAPIAMPKKGDAELGALHVRVIALESLVISLLANASEAQLNRAREMAPYIAPRSGCVSHPLTIRAADHILDLVARACRISSKPSD